MWEMTKDHKRSEAIVLLIRTLTERLHAEDVDDFVDGERTCICGKPPYKPLSHYGC